MDFHFSGTVKHSLVDGPGIRYVLFFQGCIHDCPGCHNPETHDINAGSVTTTQSIIDDMLKTKCIDGITLSGGDPMLQPLASIEIADAARSHGLNVCLYTGWTYEDILAGRAGADAKEALRHIDILIDGPFVQSLRDEHCLWRGSSNQRVIDVSASIKVDSVVLYNIQPFQNL